MPIKGVTEAYRMPRLGKIHLGVKMPNRDPNKQPYPKAVDFFVLPHEDTMAASQALLTGTDEDVKKVLTPMGRQIAEIYGARPRELDVVLTDNDIHRVFPHNYKYYRKSCNLWCTGDGEKAHRLKTGSDGKATGEGIDEIECLGEDCPEYGPQKCRRMANLMVLLPRISYGGAFQIDTSSYNSMIDVLSGIKDLLNPEHKLTHGRAAWVPLKLRVGPRKASPGGQTKTVFTMTLTLAEHAEIIALGDKMREITAALGGSLAKPPQVALPAPQQSEYEETHLIPASVQAPEGEGGEAPPAERRTMLTPEGDIVDCDTGEVLRQAERGPVAKERIEAGEPVGLTDDGEAVVARPAQPARLAPRAPTVILPARKAPATTSPALNAAMKPSAPASKPANGKKSPLSW